MAAFGKNMRQNAGRPATLAGTGEAIGSRRCASTPARTEGVMVGFAGPSLGLFAVVIAILCLASSALVTDAMLRGCQPDPGDDPAPSER